MNFRQGFFRIWIVGSVLFAGAVGVLSYEKVRADFESAGFDWNSVGILLVPVDCREARGSAKIDYKGPEGPWNAYTTVPQCWYEMHALRRLYPEYKDLTDEVLSDRLYARANIALNAPPRPWSTLGIAFLTALGIPALALFLGIALGWAISGFTAAGPKRKT